MSFRDDQTTPAAPQQGSIGGTSSVLYTPEQDIQDETSRGSLPDVDAEHGQGLVIRPECWSFCTPSRPMTLHHCGLRTGRPLHFGECVISAVSNSTFSLNQLIAAAGSSQPAGSQAVSHGQPAEPAAGVSGLPVGKSELTDEERQQVQQLQKRDAEVRQHEQAHKAAAGQHARGGATFDTQVGPDGRSYAIGGEVSIDTSPVEGDPQATIRKMQQIQAAALAPADPSSQDRQVAAQAARAAQQARAELAQQSENGEPLSNPTSAGESATLSASSPPEPSDPPAQPSQLDPATISAGVTQSSTTNKSGSILASRYMSTQLEQDSDDPGQFIDVAA